MKRKKVARAAVPEPREKAKELPTMLVEDGRMWNSLRRIIAGISRDPVLQKDLMQECLVCLWRTECEKPGRTRSWYLQNCRFHAQHWLKLGKSIDSLKRTHGESCVTLDNGDNEAVLDHFHTNGELFETVSFQDFVNTLASRLKPHEREVLRGLAEGCVLRDIASRSRLSYPTALKYRRKIAQLTLKLGELEPPATAKTARRTL
ncbi:MAG: hypothetical protein C5B50_16390 [Verrucomicrobia bacterium]|nr:MAG: hypothetical protein C5B50_16390 [Verrucomicrobiota bacterium]